jgi:hypothetical protein
VSGAFAKPKFETPDMVCRTCGKRAKGPVQPRWLDMDIRNTETGELEECAAFCRSECMTTWIMRQTHMIDPTTVELDILQCAGQAGGEYLESIGKFSLEVLSDEEWLTFLQAVIGKYEDMKIPF